MSRLRKKRQLSTVVFVGPRQDRGIPVWKGKVLADTCAQAAGGFRGVSFEGVVHVAKNVCAVFEQVCDTSGPFIEQLLLRAPNALVIGQWVPVITDEANVKREASTRDLHSFLPVGEGIGLTGAFDNDEADASFEEEAGEGSGQEVEGAGFDRQGERRRRGCKRVHEIGELTAPTAAGKGCRELDEGGTSGGSERTDDIQIGGSDRLDANQPFFVCDFAGGLH